MQVRLGDRLWRVGERLCTCMLLLRSRPCPLSTLGL